MPPPETVTPPPVAFLTEFFRNWSMIWHLFDVAISVFAGVLAALVAPPAEQAVCLAAFNATCSALSSAH